MRKFFFLTLLFIFFSSMLFAPVVVFAADPSPYAAGNYGLDEAAGIAKLKDLKVSKTEFPVLVGEIIGVGLSLIGIIFFILMLYAGFQWMTALGNSEKATKSKDMLINAVIGIVIVVSAYAISNFVFSNLIGKGDQISEGENNSGVSCCIYQANNGIFACKQIDTSKGQTCGPITFPLMGEMTPDITPGQCLPDLKEFCDGKMQP